MNVSFKFHGNLVVEIFQTYRQTHKHMNIPVWLHMCAQRNKHMCTTKDNADLSPIGISEHVVL